jgi:hypothetical protein
MTKVFTSLLLMDMVRRGEVALTDPISKYLPESVKVPKRNGRKITLAEFRLAAHARYFRAEGPGQSLRRPHVCSRCTTSFPNIS